MQMKRDNPYTMSPLDLGDGNIVYILLQSASLSSLTTKLRRNRCKYDNLGEVHLTSVGWFSPGLT